MVPRLPIWFVLLFLPVAFWPVTLAVAFFFGLFGWWFKRAGRWICWSLSGVLMLFVLAGLFRVLDDPVSDWWTHQRLKAISGKLREPRTIQGVTLPAGTYVHWSETDKSDFAQADLPGTASLLGVKVKGEVYHDLSRFETTLAEPQQIEGWACAADDVRIGNDGKLLFCVLGSDMAWHGLIVPTGSGFRLDHGVHLMMPDDRGMAVLGSFSVPPAGELVAEEDGSLRELHSSWDIEKDDKMTLVERGVSLQTDAEFLPHADMGAQRAVPVRPVGISSTLMLDLPCARETIKQGAKIEVRATGSAVRVIPQQDGELGREVQGCLK